MNLSNLLGTEGMMRTLHDELPPQVPVEAMASLSTKGNITFETEPGTRPATGAASANNMALNKLEIEIGQLKEKLLLMATHAEAAVNGALKALVRRDDDLARQTREDDTIIDRLEVEIDEVAIQLLARELPMPSLRLITTAMKIAHDLERVGDEATTISRRCMSLSREPQLPQAASIPPMGQLATEMLRDSLDSFVNRDARLAQNIIPRDKKVDAMNKDMQKELTGQMRQDPETIERCLNLMVISKSLERIADHATNVAEMVVFLCEGRDIRHANPEVSKSTRP